MRSFHVMAERIPAIRSRAGSTTDGRDTLGHDSGVGVPRYEMRNHDLVGFR